MTIIVINVKIKNKQNLSLRLWRHRSESVESLISFSPRVYPIPGTTFCFPGYFWELGNSDSEFCSSNLKHERRGVPVFNPGVTSKTGVWPTTRWPQNSELVLLFPPWSHLFLSWDSSHSLHRVVPRPTHCVELHSPYRILPGDTHCTGSHQTTPTVPGHTDCDGSFLLNRVTRESVDTVTPMCLCFIKVYHLSRWPVRLNLVEVRNQPKPNKRSITKNFEIKTPETNQRTKNTKFVVSLSYWKESYLW